MNEPTAQQPNNSRRNPAEHLAPYQFKKGQSGNPLGRKTGKSMKEYSKEMLGSMNEEERQEFLHGLGKEVIWKMGEGAPDTKTDLTTKGEKIEMNADNLAKIEAFNEWHKNQIKQPKK